MAYAGLPIIGWLDPKGAGARQHGVVTLCLRLIVAIALATTGGLWLLTQPARASCIQQTQADQIARADVIAYGRVASVDRGAGTLSFRAMVVYKGDPGSEQITVQVGPGPRGVGVATSVDYRADPGDHLLYLQRQGSEFATNDCSGSHPGPATATELGVLAAGGRVITYVDPGPDPFDARIGPALAAIAAAAVAGAVVIARRRSKAA